MMFRLSCFSRHWQGSILCLFGFVLATSVLATSIGCGEKEGGSGTPADGGSNNGSANAPGSGSQGILPLKELSAEELAALPSLDFPLPPQDGGRIIITGPDGWKKGSRGRDPKTLVRYYGGERSNDFPYIIVTGEAVNGFSMPTATRGNLDTFAEEMQAWLDKSNAILREPVKRMIFNNRVFVRYKQAGKKAGQDVDRIVLCTLVDGHLYRLELHVVSTDERSPQQVNLYAIVAALEFPKEETPSEPEVEEPAEEEPTEEPAEEGDS